MKPTTTSFLPTPSSPPDPAILRRSSNPPQPLLRPRRRTNPITWCFAFLCTIFSILLIVVGVATLVVFLYVKPRSPTFDTPSATLNSLVILGSSPSAGFLNQDLVLLVNFSNPNTLLDLAFEASVLELYFSGHLLAAQWVPTFALRRRGEARLQALSLVSSEVFLPPEIAVELEGEFRGGRVVYEVKGAFRVRCSLGFTSLTYWVYVRCQVELAGPPSGVLIARSCRTRR